MSRISSGWIKLYRIDENHWLYRESKARAFWFDLLSIATWKDSRIRLAQGIVDLPAGSVVTSRSELSARTGFGEKQVRNFLKLFEIDRMIVQQKSNKGTIITICNWEKYQNIEDAKGQQEDQQRAAHVPTDVPTEGPHIKNLRTKEERNKKLETTSLVDAEASTPDGSSNDQITVQVDRVDCQGFVNAWNENRGVLPACTKLTDDRKKKIRCRLKTNPDLAYKLTLICLHNL